MTTTQQRVALVTGASSGIGQATALCLHDAGFLVYGVARRADRMEGLSERGVRTLTMDVTDDESTALGVKQVLAESGRIDVLVNNAGYGSYGAVEDVSIEEARRQFEVNVLGGKIHTPFGAWYHGSKFALEAVSDCLRLETKAFGIDVVVIEPGAIRTEWGGIAAEHLRETSGKGAYADQAGGVADAFSSEAMAKRSSPPDVIGNTVVKAATASRPKTRYRSVPEPSHSSSFVAGCRTAPTTASSGASAACGNRSRVARTARRRSRSPHPNPIPWKPDIARTSACEPGRTTST